MSSYYPEALAEEWGAILARATRGARITPQRAPGTSHLRSVRVDAGRGVAR